MVAESKPPGRVLDSNSMRIAEVLTDAIQRGDVLSEDRPCALFYDLTVFRSECRQLVSAFPPTSMHGFAVKANPLLEMVREAHRCGMGAECASIAEVHLALAAGVPPAQVIFDSPAKTRSHLRFALSTGVYVNVDNFQELELVAELYESDPSCRTGRVGIRVNPQHGAGAIAETSTASAASKFGIPLQEAREHVLSAFWAHPWLCGLHVHVGSQGCEVSQLVEGARAIVELAEEINSRREGQVSVLDIGGGLSVDYDSDFLGITFDEYADLLRAAAPELFSGRFVIMTELGRKLNAKAGWFAAQVEYTKRAGGRDLVLSHAGADMFCRPVYLPAKWRHRIEVHDGRGHRKTRVEVLAQDIGGPLCFSGDLLAVDRDLPKIERGDWLVVRDAGAYTMSMYNRHTSQLVPAVFGYEERSPHQLQLLKPQETPEQLIAMYSANPQPPDTRPPSSLEPREPSSSLNADASRD